MSTYFLPVLGLSAVGFLLACLGMLYGRYELRKAPESPHAHPAPWWWIILCFLGAVLSVLGLLTTVL